MDAPLRYLPLIASLTWAGCVDDRAVDPTCPTAACVRHTVVASELAFELPRSADGLVVDGFDLDGAVSTGDSTDGSGCGLADKISPTGAIGIDNNLAGLFAFIVRVTGDAVFGLLQTAINQGAILVIMRLEGVDSFVDDDLVTLTVYKGLEVRQAPPQLGTDGHIAPDQTFDVDPAIASATTNGRIVDGVLEAGPIDQIVVPVRVFDVAADFRIHGARVRGRFAADGTLEGLLGGGVEAQQVLDTANMTGETQISSVAPAIVWPLADLDYDGMETCRQLSTAIRFRAVPAHLLGDAP